METFQRIVKLGYTNFWRNRWLTLGATLLMTLTLIMISVSLVLSLIVQDLATTIRSKIDLTIYFRDDAVLDSDITALGDRIKLQNGVAEVTFTDKRAALTIWNRLPINENIKRPVGESYNPLPRSLQIRSENPDNIQGLVSTIATQDSQKIICNECVSYSKNKETVDRLLSITRFVQKAGLFLSLFFGIIAVFNVMNIIRITINARADEIEIMRYVGASNAFVRGPFIVEGILYGVLGTIFTTIFLLLIAYLVSSSINTVFVSFGVDFFQLIIVNLWTLIGIQLAIGVLLGVIVSSISVRRFLKA
ncbi:MAG: permease-like cell division protein FtsX [Candidatus Berkelbacteria bacterium]|nr:permease-like cell division protein FtsX [Candidatus Berkelbacteria bacterium]